MSTATSSKIRHAFESALGVRARFNEPLAPYVAYRVGGPADILVFPREESDLVAISELSKQFLLPITIIGTGTNLLVRDEGIRGITVSLKEACLEIEPLETTKSHTLVRCGGGVLKADLLEWSIKHGLSGLEFSSGVPGTIGGGIFMNAGTKYGCYGDLIREVRLYDFEKGASQFPTNKALFGYREQKVVRKELVVWTTFELKPGDAVAIRNEVNRIIDERAAKQPLDFPSCGSTFKNPEGYSAGRLIEKCGLKGLSMGGAQVSEKHANFILNRGGASARDILGLIDIIKDRVKSEFSVQLECEVIVVGG